MKIGPKSTPRVLIGLNRVGLAGLKEAFAKADESGLDDGEALVSLLMEVVRDRNYIPAALESEYRKAVWREYLRHRGEDIRHLYSEIEVAVRGEAGEDRDRIVGALTAILAEHELQPRLRYEPPDPAGVNPQVSIADQIVARGTSRSALRKAVKAQMDDW